MTKAEAEKRRGEIVANQGTEAERIAQERALDQIRLERERHLEALQISKRQAFEEAEIAAAEEVERARIATERDGEGRATLAFFEAYFSNFIEGTEFEVEEAADIVFRNVIPRDRPEDAHDVLGTWQIVSDPVEMARTPRDYETLLALLRDRHALLMAARPDKRPGKFKIEGNRAGQTVFVAPEQVEGTLARGFEYYRSLNSPFARAVFMMFLVSEVHPFTDGNGRIARIMMNAELVSAGEERIIIPTVFRGNYLSALKAISLNSQPQPIVRTLDFARKWVMAVDWGELEVTRRVLTDLHAFVDPADADERGIRLRLRDGLAS